MKVLVVDDEVLVRRSLVRAFKAKGHEVYEAENGLTGLEAWNRENPDLVFLDVLMPGLTGPEVLKEKSVFSAKVILMSAFTGENNMETAHQLGASLFIPKPFEDIFKIVELAEGIMA